jgi:hypothetical protein
LSGRNLVCTVQMVPKQKAPWLIRPLAMSARRMFVNSTSPDSTSQRVANLGSDTVKRQILRAEKD